MPPKLLLLAISLMQSLVTCARSRVQPPQSRSSPMSDCRVQGAAQSSKVPRTPLLCCSAWRCNCSAACMCSSIAVMPKRERRGLTAHHCTPDHTAADRFAVQLVRRRHCGALVATMPCAQRMRKRMPWNSHIVGAAVQLAGHVTVKPRSVLPSGRGCSAPPEQNRAKRVPASMLSLSARHANAARTHRRSLSNTALLRRGHGAGQRTGRPAAVGRMLKRVAAAHLLPQDG
jgi:hypothetical protein